MKHFTIKRIITLGIIIIFIGASVAVPNIKILGGIENIFSVRAEEILNGAPNKPTDPEPENNSVNVSINPILRVHVTDPDNDTMNVTFYNASDQSIIGVHPNVPNGSRANVTWSNLAYNTTYSWYAIANDSYLETKSDTWNFTTIRENHPPNKPSDPEPENESTDESIDVDLSWTGGDPDGDPVTYDVYFGESSPPLLEVSNQSETTYEPGTLNYSTTYYWRIVAWDSSNATNKSAVWWFSTEDEPVSENISVTITQPKEKTFYFQGEETFSLPFNTIVYGSLDIKVNVTADNEIDRVVFDIKGLLPKKKNVTDAPYTLEGWGPLISGFYTINVTAYDEFGNNASDEIRVLKWRAHPVFLIAGTLVILKQLRSGTPFQWTILRGTVFNLRQVGNKQQARALRLHYREISPLTSMVSSGTIKFRKIAFQNGPFMFTFNTGPLGLTSYVFGIVPGKLDLLRKQ